MSLTSPRSSALARRASTPCNAPEMPNRNYAQLIVNTVSEKATIEVLRDYSTRYNGNFPDAWVRWKQLDMQAAKAPIEIRLSGDDIASLKSLGERIKTYAAKLPGVCWVRDDYGDSRAGVEVLPDLDACARLGISPSVLQFSLALSSNLGLSLGTVWEGDYPVRVIVAKEAHHMDRIEDLRQSQVPSMLAGKAVPIEQVASVRPSWDEGTIVRRNGVRTLTVRVDMEMGRIATSYQKQLESYIASLGPTPGIHVTYGGEVQDQQEQYPPMSKALLTSIAIIYCILLLQFRRHLKALLVMGNHAARTVRSCLGSVRDRRSLRVHLVCWNHQPHGHRGAQRGDSHRLRRAVAPD